LGSLAITFEFGLLSSFTGALRKRRGSLLVTLKSGPVEVEGVGPVSSTETVSDVLRKIKNLLAIELATLWFESLLQSLGRLNPPVL
jgi:hypothetical protein